MNRRCFTFGMLRTCVESADPAHLAWLEEFLAPAFTVEDDGDARYVVELIVDDERYDTLLATRPSHPLSALVCFVLDQGALSAPWWSPAAAKRIVAHAEDRVIYVVDDDGRRVQVVSARDNPSMRFALMRVVRERAMAAAWTQTSLVLHAAAIAAGGRGIAIAGPKHAGKTSLLIHCLQAPGVRFVSNDRVVMDLSEAAPTLQGMPTIVSIREDTLRFFPTLLDPVQGGQFHSRLTLAEVRQRVPSPGDRRRSGSLSPKQLCHLLNVPMTREVTGSVLLLPRVDTAVEGIVVRPLSAAEAGARLTDVLFAATATHRTSEVFGVGPCDASTEPATLQRLWRAATGRLRAFECVLGEGAFRLNSAADVIGRVLATP